MFRDRTAEFKASRKRRKETCDINEHRLLQRLEKLLFKGPSNAQAAQRKEYEQSVVPWLEGKMVPRCPECANKFSITRRRHHCRLCGAVICNDCSLGLDVGATVSLTVAPRLTDSRMTPKQAEAERQRRIAAKKRQLVLEEDSCLRICPFCQQSLRRSQVRQLKEATSKEVSPTVRLYEEMKRAQAAILKKLPDFNSFVHRIVSSGAVGLHADARKMKADIVKHFDTLRKISRAAAGGGGVDVSDRPSTQRVFASIQAAIREFLQLYTVAMAELPDEEDIAAIAAQKQREAEERRRAQEAEEEQKRRRRQLQQQQQQQQHEQQQRVHGEAQPKHAAASTTSIASLTPSTAASKAGHAQGNRRSVLGLLRGGRNRGSNTGVKGSSPSTSSGDNGRQHSNTDDGAGTAEVPEDFEDIVEAEKRSLLAYLRQAQKAGRTDEVEMLKTQLQHLEVFRSESAVDN